MRWHPLAEEGQVPLVKGDADQVQQNFWNSLAICHAKLLCLVVIFYFKCPQIQCGATEAVGSGPYRVFEVVATVMTFGEIEIVTYLYSIYPSSDNFVHFCLQAGGRGEGEGRKFIGLLTRVISIILKVCPNEGLCWQFCFQQEGEGSADGRGEKFVVYWPR